MNQSSFLNYLCDVFYELLHVKENKNLTKDVLIKQILFTGYEVLPFIILMGLMFGVIIIHEGSLIFGALGQKDWTHQVLVSAMIRDFAPILISFIILARSGTAISTELGTMNVNKEINALVAMGISVISYIVIPRIFGVIISLILLNIYFAIVGLFGGYLVSSLSTPLSFTEFFTSFIRHLDLIDIFLMLFKLILSGFSISIICSFNGLNAKTSITEIPQRNIKAVSQSIIAIILTHLLGLIILFALQGNS